MRTSVSFKIPFHSFWSVKLYSINFNSVLQLHKYFPGSSQKEISFQLKLLNPGTIMQIARRNLFNLQPAA